MIIGIPKETVPRESRVALSPDLIENYLKLGFEIELETGAGIDAGYADETYQTLGVRVVDRLTLWAHADILLKIRAPELTEIDSLKVGATVICQLGAGKQNTSLWEQLRAKKCNLIALEAVPRISRAQKMDILSSMANIAGYRAVVEAAGQYPGFFTGQMTAAGKIPPAKVLIIGAGVAGLAAIGAARGLGAIVRAFDIRKEVADQIKSMGAQFLTVSIDEEGSGAGGYAKTMSPAFIKAEMDLFKSQAKEVDIIITTALIPGRPAPILIDEEVFAALKPGSVVIDLAAEQGGNCCKTIANRVVEVAGVKVVGHTDYPSQMAGQASKLFAKNLYHLMAEFSKEGVLHFNLDDDIMRGALVMFGGESPQFPARPTVVPPVSSPAPATDAGKGDGKKSTASNVMGPLFLVALLALMVALIRFAPVTFFSHLTVFVLSCFVGYQVIWSVKPALHTPLMSVTNAISGIIILGALIPLSIGSSPVVIALSGVACLLASINVVGGFFVTHKMLRMFRR